MEQNTDDKPVLFAFKYSLNTDKFKEWLTNHPELTEGPLVFMAKGIEICVPWGAEKYDKSGFSFDGPGDTKVWLQLIQQPAIFHIHRDVFSGKEWECFYEMD